MESEANPSAAREFSPGNWHETGFKFNWREKTAGLT
jgi:hypothetical protein